MSTVDSRAIVRMDIGVYIGRNHIKAPTITPDIRSMSFRSTDDIDRSAYEGRARLD